MKIRILSLVIFILLCNIADNDTLMIENIFLFQAKHCHGSSIVELPNIDLLVVWFHGSGERTADDVAIMGSRRNHNSGEWCEPFATARLPGGL